MRLQSVGFAAALAFCALIFLALCTLISGFGPKPDDYAAQTPVFTPEKFFNGSLQSWGVQENAVGRQKNHFTMVATAAWQGDSGSQHEVLHFFDGTVKTRDWRFTRVDAHHVTGTAPDVVGEARGEYYGNALHWVYDIRVQSKSGEHVVTFDDWLYLIDDTHMFSRVHIRKWGLPVGTLTMFFEKSPSPK